MLTAIALTLLTSASGDLNGDGIPDVVEITAAPDAPADDESPATLSVYFVDAQGKRALQVEAKEAACVHCGGMKGGDFPFQLSIAKGVIVLQAFGGAREAFAQTTRWRYRDGKFRLIGITDDLTDSIASEKGAIAHIVRDCNLSTLKCDEIVEKVGAAPAKKRCAADAKYRGYTLDRFRNDLTAPACTNAALE
jgi:hypothetical protein